MNFLFLFVLLQVPVYGLGPSKSLNKITSLSQTTKKIRKFVKGVGEFLSSKKPGSSKAKKPTKNPTAPTKRSPRKTTRPRKNKAVKTSADTGESDSKSNFARQVVVAGVGGGALTLIPTSKGEKTDYDYEYVTETVPTEVSTSTVSLSHI